MELGDDIRALLAPRFSGRFWPDVPSKTNTVRPYGIYSMPDAVPNNTLDGPKGSFWRYQVDVFADTRKDANAVADLCQNDMESGGLGRPALCILRQHLYEDEVELYRTLLQFSVYA